MDDKLKHLIEQNKGYITRKQIIGNRYLYYQLLESVPLLLMGTLWTHDTDTPRLLCGHTKKKESYFT